MNIIDVFYKGLDRISSENILQLSKHIIDNELFWELCPSRFIKYILYRYDKIKLYKELLINIYELLKKDKTKKNILNDYIEIIGLYHKNKYNLKILDDSFENCVKKYLEPTKKETNDIDLNIFIEDDPIRLMDEKQSKTYSGLLNNIHSDTNNSDTNHSNTRYVYNYTLLDLSIYFNSLKCFKYLILSDEHKPFSYNYKPFSYNYKPFSYRNLCSSNNFEYFRILEQNQLIDYKKIIRECIRYRMNYELLLYCLNKASLNDLFENSLNNSKEFKYKINNEIKNISLLEYCLLFSVEYSNFQCLDYILEKTALERPLRFIGIIEFDTAFTDECEKIIDYDLHFIEYLLKSKRVLFDNNQLVAILYSKQFDYKEFDYKDIIPLINLSKELVCQIFDKIHSLIDDECYYNKLHHIELIEYVINIIGIDIIRKDYDYMNIFISEFILIEYIKNENIRKDIQLKNLFISIFKNNVKNDSFNLINDVLNNIEHNVISTKEIMKNMPSWAKEEIDKEKRQLTIFKKFLRECNYELTKEEVKRIKEIRLI